LAQVGFHAFYAYFLFLISAFSACLRLTACFPGSQFFKQVSHMFFSWQLNISLQFVFALLGCWARLMLRPAVVGHRHFQLIFTDQSVQFAELRIIILPSYIFHHWTTGPLNLQYMDS
jgi:hypothetical protein